MFDAGLILTPAQGTRTGLIAAIIAGVFSPFSGSLFFLFSFQLILFGSLSARNSTAPLTRPSYFPGIFEACWWAAPTLATQADQMPRTALARLIAVI